MTTTTANTTKVFLSTAAALRIIAETTPQFMGRHHSAEEVEAAYNCLGHPFDSYVRAKIGLGKILPVCGNNEDEDDWLRSLPARLCDPNEIITAIHAEVPNLKAPDEAADIMVGRVRRRMGDGPFTVQYAHNQPAAERPVHIVDANGRIVVCHALELGTNGPLRIMDAPYGQIARSTREASGWQLRAGWCVSCGFGSRVRHVATDEKISAECTPRLPR